MGKKKTKATTEIPAETSVATATEPTPAPEPKKKGKTKKVKGDAPATKPSGGARTLADISHAYLGHMDSAGKSGGTISSYAMELRTANVEIGADTLISDLTPARVQEFFNCKRVMKLRSGKPKAKPSYDKTRRVLRLALVWAAETGLIEKAPLPEEPVEAKA
jgi:hypothetical protein